MIFSTFIFVCVFSNNFVVDSFAVNIFVSSSSSFRSFFSFESFILTMRSSIIILNKPNCNLCFKHWFVNHCFLKSNSIILTKIFINISFAFWLSSFLKSSSIYTIIQSRHFFFVICWFIFFGINIAKRFKKLYIHSNIMTLVDYIFTSNS